MFPVKLFVFGLLDILTFVNLVDYFTWHLQSRLVLFWYNIFMSMSCYTVTRAFLFGWVFYRVIWIAWRRYKVHQCLIKKQATLLDKHGRLHTKLKGLDTKPEQIGDSKLTELTLAEIKQRLRQGKLQAIELLDTYQIHALDLFKSHSNCVSELIFEADVYAFIVDPILQDPSANLTPIHGIPIAIEELFPVRGYDHTMGFVTCTNKPAENDCILVQALKECGAIPFVLTNSKQKITGLKAENPIFGTTRHPTHPNRCCVSGAAVFVAHNGSPIAIGTDIIGEARLSAAFCGKVGFKPTPQRISQKGLNLPIGLPEVLSPVASPIGNNVDNMADLLRSLWTNALFQLDRSLFPATFDEGKYSKLSESCKLRIGYYTGFDDLLRASCGTERIVDEVVNYLKSQGHELIPFQVPNANQAFETAIGLLATFMEPELLRLVYGEGYGDLYEDHKQRILHLFYALPKFIKKTIANRRAKAIQEEHPVTSLVLNGLGCDESYSELMSKIQEHMTAFFTAWNEAELDLLICPVSPIPAPWENCLSYTTNCVLLYTCLFNVFGCPAGTVPIGQVRKDDIELSQYSIHKQSDDPRWWRTLQMYAAQYRKGEGLPLGIQVVGKPWDDELVLGMLKYLESMPK